MKESKTQMAASMLDVHVRTWTRENGLRIRKAREKRGWSVETICRYTGIGNLYQYQRIEKGQQAPLDEQLRAIMFRLGISPMDVFGHDWRDTAGSDDSADMENAVGTETVEKEEDEPDKTEDMAEDMTETEAGSAGGEAEPSEEMAEPKKETGSAGTIGQRLNAARLKSGLTWKEISAASNLTDVTVRNYEKDTRIPSQEAIKNLAHIYGMTVYELVTVSEYRRLRRNKNSSRKTKPVRKTPVIMEDPKIETAVTVPGTSKTVESTPEPVSAGPSSMEPEKTESETVAHDEEQPKGVLSPEAARLGNVIRMHREKCGLTEFKVADAICVSEKRYRELEAGKADITLSQLFSLAKLLRMQLDKVAGEIFKTRWRVFIPEDGDKLSMYGMIGLCHDHSFLYEVADDYEQMSIFSGEEIQDLMKNIRIRGRLI